MEELKAKHATVEAQRAYEKAQVDYLEKANALNCEMEGIMRGWIEHFESNLFHANMFGTPVDE